MICKKCGREAENGALVCSYCGNILNKKPFYKKWWFWVIISVAVIGITSGTASVNEKPKKETGNFSSTNSTSESEETFGITDTAVFNTIKVTAEELKESTGKNYFEPDNGNVFVGVRFTIENTSEEDQTISSLLLFDAYCDGTKCDYSINANCAFNEGTIDGTLAPGKKMTGYFAVEVPKDWKELELQVKSGWLSNIKAAFVFNK